MAITGFDKQTTPLTTLELMTVPHIVKLFTGATTPLSNNAIATYIRTIDSQLPKMDGPRVRKIINHIRTKRLVKNLIANSKGYYVAMSDKEVQNYVKSLNERINAITVIRDSYTENPA